MFVLCNGTLYKTIISLGVLRIIIYILFLSLQKINNMLQEKITKLYLNTLTKPVKDITEVEIKKAKDILSKLEIILSANHLFLVLASINLLNAAIKKKHYKNKLSYFIIKTKATYVLELLIKSESMDNTSYYYNNEEKCMYVKVHGVIFSFHNIYESDIILNNNSLERIDWTGIRLQKIAVEVFELGLKLQLKSQFT